ncbi:LysR family transcriptional regulator [Kitasatospora sp. NPDC101155]|uniref:LysR family transcriptional regulator n=1 Tax=Kitasatospora sp. NPDC101155 TaxID=3364097 RepID=UPI00382DA907
MNDLSGIEFRHLRYFAAVAEAGTVTEAARRLHITQPSLSQQIRALERRVAAPLFHRGPVGMSLTAAGQTLLDGANRALGELHAAMTSARGAALPARIGVCHGLPQEVLATAEQLVTRNRSLHLGYHAVDSHDQADRLRTGKLDFGILRGPADETGLTTRVLADQPLGVVVGRAHPLADRTSVTWPELDGQRLLWFPESAASGYASTVLAQLAVHGWTPRTTPGDHDHSSHTLFRHALLGDDTVIALRPAAAVADDPALTWLPLGTDAPRERLLLAAPTATIWSRLLA